MPKKDAEDLAIQHLEKVQIADQANKISWTIIRRPATEMCNSQSFMYGTKNNVI